MSMNDEKKGPLARAIAQQSAEWLEALYPNVFDALVQELGNGKSIEDIKTILRRIFGLELREPFVLRLIQAAEYLRSELG